MDTIAILIEFKPTLFLVNHRQEAYDKLDIDILDKKMKESNFVRAEIDSYVYVCENCNVVDAILTMQKIKEEVDGFLDCVGNCRMWEIERETDLMRVLGIW